MYQACVKSSDSPEPLEPSSFPTLYQLPTCTKSGVEEQNIWWMDLTAEQLASLNMNVKVGNKMLATKVK
jgi:hypothetical protein